MYMPYAEANAVRLRLMLASEGRWRHVSTIYQIPNGWAWTLCNECPPHDAAARPSGSRMARCASSSFSPRCCR